MAGNRKEAEAFCLKYIEKLTDKFNRSLYEKKFAAMSDKQFDDFITQLENEEINLVIITPNFTGSENPVENNLNLLLPSGQR